MLFYQLGVGAASHLAQTVATIPMVMIGTYRDVELNSSTAFTRMVESLVRQKQVVRITLGRFDASAVADMLRELSGQVAPDAVAREIFERTEGNPFFVEEVFRHLAGEGLLFEGTLAPSGHPLCMQKMCGVVSVPLGVILKIVPQPRPAKL